jgi:uncharacterized protein YhhL (DUF1145 family)
MMLKIFLLISKLAALGFYALVPASYLIPSLGDYSCTLAIIAAALLAAHVAEYLWVRQRLVALPGTTAYHLINTLLFGFLHWLPLLRALKK